ncbi:hypothetical protein ACS0TY_002858 [Phlomoides rotata]
MGLLLLLKFALVCIDYLAWPVIALGYPLFASIRAVENDSKYHMKKLIIYWTLFSLISLFEFTFLKLIVWIPFWDSIRLIAIIWLVMPRFQGACHAYQILVRPVLSIDLRAVIDKLYKTNEEKYLMKATFLDVAEQYIKENGLEALERLIATKFLNQRRKMMWQHQNSLFIENMLDRLIGFIKLTQLIISLCLAYLLTVQYAETTPPDSSDRPPEIPPTKNPPQEWTCEICKVTTTSETTLNAHLQGSKHRSNCESLKRSMFHAEETRSSSSSDRPPEIPPIKNSRQEWTCDICKVMTTSETTLNAHLQGSKHRSNCESLKGSKFHAEETRSSSSSDRPPEIPSTNNPPQEWTREICKVTTTSETTLNAHLQGSEHRSNCESLKRSKFHAEETRSSSSSDRPPEIPPIKNPPQEWTCDICKVTTTSETTLNAHLQGSKHRSNFESLKSSKFHAEDTISSSSSDSPPEIPPIKNSRQEWTCDICKVTTTSEATLNAHLQGSKHRSNFQSLKGSKIHAEDTRSSSSSDRPPEIPPNKNSRQEWTCDICKVTTTSEAMLNAHLQGSEHRSNCESLKGSRFHAEDTRSSSSSDSPPEIPPIKNSRQEWTCDICKVTTTSETTLNAHLQGSKHRSNCESLIGSKFHAEDTRSSSSSDSPPEIPPIKNSRQEWTCDICKVTTTSEATLNAHLQGSEHRSNCESLKGNKFHAEDTRPSSSSDMPLEIPPIKKFQQEWNCDICKVTTTSETTLNAHLQGSKHRSNCESLKESKFHAGDTRPSSSRSDQGSWLKQAKPKQDGGTNQIFELYCNVCSLKLNTCSCLASHIKGKRHLSNITTMKQDAGTNQILKLYCNVCSLKLNNSIDLASHVKGKRHLSNIAEISSTN